MSWRQSYGGWIPHASSAGYQYYRNIYYFWKDGQHGYYYNYVYCFPSQPNLPPDLDCTDYYYYYNPYKQVYWCRCYRYDP